MPHVETGIIEVQHWQHFRRPVVRTQSGVYLLDHPYWISQAGRTISVRIINADQFAEVVEEVSVGKIREGFGAISARAGRGFQKKSPRRA